MGEGKEDDRRGDGSPKWADRLLDMIVMGDVKKVQKRHQRKAFAIYILLLSGYLVAMAYATYAMFAKRARPATSVSIENDPLWLNPPPPNMVVCHWMWPNPVWHVASYLSLDKKAGTWVWEPSFRDRVQAMNCSGYEPCIFIKGSREGPEDMQRFPAGRSMDIKVGYTIPGTAESTADMGLSVWFTDTPTAQQLCKGKKGDYRFIRGYTPATSFLLNGGAGSSGKELEGNTVFPYDVMTLTRTKNVTLKVRQDNVLLTDAPEELTYQASLSPSVNTSAAGLDWSIVLGSACGPQDEACVQKELQTRNQELVAAGRESFYFHFQVWLHESMTVVRAVDPVDFGGLSGTWGGAWGLVTFIFGLLFWGAMWDTREAAVCLRCKWWTGLCQRLRRSEASDGGGSSDGDTERGTLQRGGGSRGGGSSSFRLLESLKSRIEFDSLNLQLHTMAEEMQAMGRKIDMLERQQRQQQQQQEQRLEQGESENEPRDGKGEAGASL